MKYKPHPYQKKATDLILEKDSVALWLDMGMGKTVSTLTAIKDLEGPRLIIAPLRVAKDTWSREIEKWDHLQGMTTSLILGSKKERMKALETDADLHIINRENVTWLVNTLGGRWPFKVVVIDESSSFKSAQSQRFKSLKSVLPKIDRMIQLTGTPSPNGLMDLWSQVYLLDRGQRLGRTLGEYRRKYFREGRRNGHIVYEYIPLEGSAKRIENRLSDIVHSMSAEDWLTMPERIDLVHKVELDIDAYNQLEKDLVIRMGGVDIVASNPAVLAGKLLQMANGAVYGEDGKVVHIHDTKLDHLESIVEESESVLIFYSYKHDLERIKKRFSDARTLQGPKDISDWNDGKIRVLLAHPASSGHGLNLQQGGHVIAWFGLPWSLELYQQANARLHRQGQDKSVIVHHLIAKDTLDEHVLRVLTQKDARQKDLLESLKAYVG